jgi:hypothetical protein
MRLNQPYRQKRFALLFAALLLLCNALVTAHAFGDVDHAVKDGCQICHQFERQAAAPLDSHVPLRDTRRHVLPVRLVIAAFTADVERHFEARAPPLV